MNNNISNIIRNITAIRVACVALLVIISSSSFAQEKAISYKSKTVDECIHEKECVWSAFSKQLGINDYARWTVQGKALNKWSVPLFFKATAVRSVKPSDYLPHLTEEIIDPLKPLVPGGINPGGRYAIVFSDDIQDTIDTWSKDLSKLKIESQRTKTRYLKYEKGTFEGCHTVNITEEGKVGITLAVTFVDIKNKNAKYCASTHFYYALGLWGHLKDQQFSFFSGDVEYKDGLTKLDKFLVYLLYQPEFKIGQSSQLIKETFEKVYSSKKQNFLSLSKGD